MKLSDAKRSEYIVFNDHAPSDMRKRMGRGPFKITKILKRVIHIQGSTNFTITTSELSAFFQKCPLKYVA